MPSEQDIRNAINSISQQFKNQTVDEIMQYINVRGQANLGWYYEHNVNVYINAASVIAEKKGIDINARDAILYGIYMANEQTDGFEEWMYPNGNQNVELFGSPNQTSTLNFSSLV